MEENSFRGRHGTSTQITGPNGIQAFQKFIETHCPSACVPVDLLKIAHSVGISNNGRRGQGGPATGTNMTTNRRISHQYSHIVHPSNFNGPLMGPANVDNYRHMNNNGPRLSLVVDGECCLDRLYGGYFSDWVCGGQWNRMIQFLAVLAQTVRHNNIEMTIFFNGGLESERMPEWIAAQQLERRKVSQILRHLDAKGTPPPKVWWSAPICLRTCLLMSARHLEVNVVVTMDDHRQEVIAYCRENNFHGLVADDSVYAVFNPPRYFSAQKLKLTYKGSLETKEFILDEVAKMLDLHPGRLCVFAALLGNCMLTESDLAEFYSSLPIENGSKATSETYIKAISAYVRNLASVDNLDVVGAQIFTGGKGRPDPRIHKFKTSVQYYLNGTKDGFLRYRPTTFGRKEPSHYVATWSANVSQNLPQADNDLGKFASDTQENELSSLSGYKEVTCNGTLEENKILTGETLSGASSSSKMTDRKETTVARNGCVEGDIDVQNRSAQMNGGSLSGTSNPGEGSTSTRPSVQPKVPGSYASSLPVIGGAGSSGGYPHQPQPSFYMPTIQPEVMRTTSERHQKGMMSPWILQVLTHGELKLPICLEEDVPSELPSSAHLYRPIRQMVYGILFNLHHLVFQAKQKQEMQSAGSNTGETVPDILVKEWVWTKYNQYRTPDLVRAEPLGWPVPTVQRLWFGNIMDDKKRRLRAFLTCMHSDTPLMLNASFVPQHLLVLCCVLRYMLAQSSSEMRILSSHELSAFLAQAVSPRLMDAQYMQQVQLPIVSSRSVQLASLFMRGVETALFANDACGAPIPWLMSCPWLFFDGKLLHLKLHQANGSKDLLDICEGQSEQVLKVERMRQAILKGLKVEFARRTLVDVVHRGMGHNQYLPAGAHWSGGQNAGRSRGNTVSGRRAVIARGGQLEIAGVVVGCWGANFGTNARAGRGGGGGNRSVGGSGTGGGNRTGADGGNSGAGAPQVTSVGGPKRGRPGYVKRYGNGNGVQNWYTGAPMGRGQPSYSIRGSSAVSRRSVASGSFQAQGNRKAANKKVVSKLGGLKTSSLNGEAQLQRKAKSSSDKSTASTKQSIKSSGTLRNGGTEDQFEDAGTVSNGESTMPKSSPIIMKKPSVDDVATTSSAATNAVIVTAASTSATIDVADMGPSNESAVVIPNENDAINIVINVDEIIDSSNTCVNIVDEVDAVIVASAE